MKSLGGTLGRRRGAAHGLLWRQRGSLWLYQSGVFFRLVLLFVLGMCPHVSLQVTLVAGVVATQAADELLDTGVHGEVPLEQRLAAEHVAAHGAHVAVTMQGTRMCSHVSFVEETLAAALQLYGRRLVHGLNVALQVVLSVRHVATKGTHYKAAALLAAPLATLRVLQYRHTARCLSCRTLTSEHFRWRRAH
ncbi:hypothetical protein E2C01_044686 [Portunus trituberculatus]|uniref:Uncharacterized protein n=1 Tax=Portunus trituberculatus TaxID=210409 RepID=A0A5B7G0N9_PORTR|nr:hypothetical protein [Portunus trituberculatus]